LPTSAIDMFERNGDGQVGVSVALLAAADHVETNTDWARRRCLPRHKAAAGVIWRR
jgi:hypothetical protein